MNSDFKNFTDNIGVMCETWVLVYQKFTILGFDHEKAIDHTKAFMSSMIDALTKNGDVNGT